jgi:hypothetical protein
VDKNLESPLRVCGLTACGLSGQRAEAKVYTFNRAITTDGNCGTDDELMFHQQVIHYYHTLTGHTLLSYTNRSYTTIIHTHDSIHSYSMLVH